VHVRVNDGLRVQRAENNAIVLVAPVNQQPHLLVCSGLLFHDINFHMVAMAISSQCVLLQRHGSGGVPSVALSLRASIRLSRSIRHNCSDEIGDRRSGRNANLSRIAGNGVSS
jgi:hypothetical protein